MLKQGSEEWKNQRLGKVTASRLKDVMAKTKSGYSASRKNYMMELLCEKLSGVASDGFSSSAMQRGTELEPLARAVYEAETGNPVAETGFIIHPQEERFGASPDGLVGSEGLVEIKCPNTATHVDFLKTRTPKREYILQMHGQMLCAGRKWCHFVSYDDRIQGLEYKSVLIEFDKSLAEEIFGEVLRFLKELDDELEMIEKLRAT